MKFNKKVVESGIVAVFALTVASTAVFSTDVITQSAAQRPEREFTEETSEKETEEATIEKAEVSLVAQAAEAVEAKRTVKQTAENSPKAKAAKAEKTQEAKAEKAEAVKAEEVKKAETTETAEKTKSAKTEKAEKTETAEAEKSEKAETAEKMEKTEKAEKTQKAEKEAEAKKAEKEAEAKKAEKAEKEAEAKKAEKEAEAKKAEKEAEAKKAEKAEKEAEAKEAEKAEKEAEAKEAEKAEEKAEAEKEEKTEKKEAVISLAAQAAEAVEEAQKETEKKAAAGKAAEATIARAERMVSHEVSPWAAKLMPKVEDFLNIRAEASDEAELVGKIHKGAAADIIEQGDVWTKISSGSVEGYVKNEFCVTGFEAESLAEELGTTYVIATSGGVRVRAEASSEEGIEILDVMEEGGKLKADKEAAKTEGWVAVKTGDKTGYVSEEFVKVELELGKAISIEEERAAIAAAEAEKARKAQAAQKASAGTQQKAAVAASYDDVTLLGALIQCEAGSESYEGQLAVGAVVMNRLRAGYAGSISGVIYQPGQFTPASSGRLASVLQSGVRGSCLQAAQQAISGADNVNGAKSFRNKASGRSGLVIGNHVFF